MTQQQILGLNTTKTEKIKLLLQLGKTRREVSDIMGVGYGFVQNVYARTFPERIRRRTSASSTQLGAVLFQLPNFNRKFGVEIEFFGTGTKRTLLNKIRAKGIEIVSEGYNHTTRNHWKIVTDSSIRPSRGTGMEIVSPILKGANGLEQLNKICTALEEWGGLINKTCGIHIHFDAANFSIPTWRNLYKNYIICESTIDSMMPNSRRANNNYYCKSVTNHSGSKTTAFRKLNEANTVLELSKKIANRNRYCKINAESFFRHKSIEFRQHSGTIEYAKISNWILLLHGIVSYSEKDKIIADGNFNTMKVFMKNETHNFYHNRIQELAA
jgi:hypothetical protein